MTICLEDQVTEPSRDLWVHSSTGPHRSRLALRALAAAAIVFIIFLCASDYWTEYWADHPMLTAFLSGFLLVVVGGAVVDSVISIRSRRRWLSVAALAITQMRDSLRNIMDEIADSLDFAETSDGGTTRSPRSGLAGSIAGDTLQFRKAAASVLETDRGRRQMLTGIESVLPSAQDVAGSWAPVMVSEQEYAPILNRYVAMLNGAWRITWALDQRISGRALPVDEAIIEEVRLVVDDMLASEQDFTDTIRSLLPWPDSFGPAATIVHNFGK